ncbi:hypothetical protein [Catenuloplanes atrovinosus]|uniref:Uncharacterized protein n=1 Tax=Catenuloplanes atrovinosus TaxID=137266 RepID=A0AAE3YMA2_9ACTN|nr:hypothetical protein [Catenuloplanes atrovinosus]MDR7275132.1 hypothetical protein [Catenuloplanes atrovinosus]
MWRTTTYLIGVCNSALLTVLALPLLLLPTLAVPWAVQHRQNADEYRKIPTDPGTPTTTRALLWLPIHATTGTPNP